VLVVEGAANTILTCRDACSVSEKSWKVKHDGVNCKREGMMGVNCDLSWPGPARQQCSTRRKSSHLGNPPAKCQRDSDTSTTRITPILHPEENYVQLYPACVFRLDLRPDEVFLMPRHAPSHFKPGGVGGRVVEECGSFNVVVDAAEHSLGLAVLGIIGF
jgi:hypothetical protein